jgi:4-hydroxybenzoate polyprenyltransferase
MSDSLQVVRRVLKLRAWRVGIIALPIQVCYFSIFYLGLKTAISFDVFQLLLLIFCLWLYFAYIVLINDLFDRDVDAQVGKATIARGHGLNPIYMGIFLLLIILVNSVLVVLLRGEVIFNTLWISAYFLGTIYSAPPFNLKARGFLGLLCDSLIEKPLPVLIVFTFFGYYGFEIILFPIFAEMLDSVFKHQAQDYLLDVKAKVRTFAVVLGKDLSDKVVNEVIHPVNVLLVLAVFLIVLFQIPQVRTITLIIFAALLIAFVAILVKAKKHVFQAETLGWANPPYVVFFNAGFQVLLICILGIVLTVENPAYLFLLLLFMLSLTPYLRNYVKIGLKLLRYTIGWSSA